VVADIVPEEALVVPVLVPTWSRTELETRPENAFTAIAFAVVLGKVTTMKSLVVRAVVTGAEKTSVRTPDVADDEFGMSASRVYVFFEVAHDVDDVPSQQETVPDVGSIATVTMIVLPVPMATAGTLIEVLLVSFAAVPTAASNAGAPCASRAKIPNVTTALSATAISNFLLSRRSYDLISPPTCED
jgi:hypothetical protein